MPEALGQPTVPTEVPGTAAAVAAADGLDTVHIVLSTFNGARFLSSQLASLSSQSHVRWHLLVRDDGSSDQSPEIIGRISAKDARIELLNDTDGNLGVVQSFSRLLQECKLRGARYVMLCDQDDVWHQDKVARTLQVMKSAEARHPSTAWLVHSDLEVVDEFDHTLSQSMWTYSHIDPQVNQLNRLLVQNTVTGCAAMLNGRLLQLLDSIPRQALMHDWWIALVAALVGRIEILHEPTMRYRQHANNVAGIAQQGSMFKMIGHIWQNLRLDSIRKVRGKLIVSPALQALVLANTYPALASPAQLKTLHDFGSIDGLGWLARRRCLYAHGIWRQRLRHNVSLLFLV